MERREDLNVVKRPPSIAYDPYSTATLSDPYDFYEAVRETAPVVFLEKYGVYAVGRHDVAAEVLTDHGRFTAQGGVGLPDIRKPGSHRIPNRILENDPPNHTAVRRMVTSIISPAVVRAWRARFEQEAAALVDRLIVKGEFNGVEELTEAFVLKVFAESVGVQLPRVPTLAISEMSFNQAGPNNELRRASDARAVPYLEWYDSIVQREVMPIGSVGALLYAAQDRGEIEEGVAEGVCRVLVRAGTDTTIAGIGFALLQLAANPDQWAAVRANPDKVKAAFEEAIRHESPSYTNFRTTVSATELAGYRLEGDTKIGVFLGSVGRDPRKWRDPSKFDVTREVIGRHLSFGIGTHVCIGQMIARLESECLLKAMAARIDRLELAGEHRFRPINQLRTLDVLPLRVVGS